MVSLSESFWNSPHHTEDGHAVDAAAEIEFDETIDRGEVDSAGIGERRGGDDVDALGVGGELG